MDGLDSIGYSTLVVCIFFAILATAAVIARLYTRRLLKAGLGADDWWIIVGLIGYYAYTADALIGLFTSGGGQQYEDPLVEQSKLMTYLKSEYVIGLLYSFAVSFVKFSVICLYRRLFTVQSFRNTSLIVGVLCFLWMVVAIVCGALYCIPAKSFWDHRVPGHCFNYDDFFLAMEIVDVILDIAILCLPFRMIAALHLSLRKKFMLSGIFLLGSFVCVTGAVRIALVYQPGSIIISFTKASLWSSIQLGTAIICACLPTYKPLLSHIISMGGTLRQLYTSLLKSRTGSTGGKSSSPSTIHTGNSQYERMANSNANEIHLTEVSGGKQHSDISPFDDYPPDSINVRHDVRVV